MKPLVQRREFVRSGVAAAAMITSSVSAQPDMRLAFAADDDANSPESVMKMKSFPFYRARGTFRELGRQHGEQAIVQIQSHVEYLRSSLKLSKDDLHNRSMKFAPLFQRYCPHLMDEIHGLSEGSKISLADALAVNIRGALAKAGDGGCTAFVVGASGTAKGEILIGQNSDQLPAGLALGYVLYLQPIDKPEVLMWTFGGMIGYHGINSFGVGHFANDLGGGPAPRLGMPHYPSKRLMLECSSLVEVEALVRRTQFWANGNYVLCDGQGRILDIEATPEGPQFIDDSGTGFICHSNHFLCSKYATDINHRLSAKDSFTRLDRINSLIREAYGRITVDDCQRILRDRDGQPCGICRIAQTEHPDADWVTAGITVASIIAEPAQRRIHVACGNSPDNSFVTYAMDA